MSLFLTAKAAGVEEVVEAAKNSSPDGFAQMIADYGPTVVILAVFLSLFVFIVLALLKKSLKTNEEEKEQSYRDDMAKVVDEIVSHILPVIQSMPAKTDNTNNGTNQLPAPKSTKSLVEETIKTAIIFKNVSKTALTSLDCQRIAIYVFHNGNKSISGYPFIKFTCIYEYTNHNVEATIRGKNHKDIIIYEYSDMVNPLITDNEYVCSNIDNLDSQDQIVKFIAGSDVNSIYMRAIKSEDDDIIGFTVAEFSSYEDFLKVQNDGSLRRDMEAYNAVIKPIINHHQMKETN